MHAQAVGHLNWARKELKQSGGQFLLGELSYADLAMAITVAQICPPGQPPKLPAARNTILFPSQELYDACKDIKPWAADILDKQFP